MRALKFGCLKKGVYAQGVPMCLPRKRTPKKKLRLLLGGLRPLLDPWVVQGEKVSLILAENLMQGEKSSCE